MSIEIHAPCKVNLFLDVLGKRPDGFHDLQSLVMPVSVRDTLTLAPHPDGILVHLDAGVMLEGIPWPIDMGRPDDNLVTRAARLLKDATGYSAGAEIRLVKRIPVAAGLGGGSADAAAVLRGLNTLWQTGLTHDDLMALGAQLGSDIPALIHGGPACMEGRGERVTPLPRLADATLWMVLVYPGFGTSTADAYNRFNPRLTPPPAPGTFMTLLSGIEQRRIETVGGCLYNALQATVFRKYPLLEMIRDALVRAGAVGALLSGSGSTVFALVRDPDHGRDVEARYRAGLGHPAWTRVVSVATDGGPG